MKDRPAAFTRRNMLELICYAGATAAASYIGIKISGSETEREICYPQPRWLNPDGNKLPRFFNVDNGHQDYLKACVGNSPVLQSALRQVFDRRFLYRWDEPPLLGDEFESHCLIAESVLTDQGYRHTAADRLRAASLTFAASSILTTDEIGKISDVKFPQNSDATNAYFIQSVMHSFPRVFPVDCNKEVNGKARIWNYLGVDRFIHASQHQSITSEMTHLKDAGVGDDELLPPELPPLLESYRPGRSRTVAFSEIVAYGWEGLESLKNPPYLVKLINYNDGVQTGFYDRFVSLDLYANSLGALAGIAGADRNITEDRCAEIIRVMNDPAVTFPLKDVWHPKVEMDFTLPIAV